MAQLAFAEFGRRAGAAILPGGFGLSGFSASGAAIGQALGAMAGRAIDAAFSGPVGEVGRIDGLTLMESREGAGIPRVYGRYRIGGQVIWSTNLKERSRDRQIGGKGGASVTEYSYTISFAVALCEGEVTGIDRVWANGELLSLADVTWRLYTGSETQLPDPIIEASEGIAPAYRGTAYIVFEDFPLDDYGARLPQLSFEVIRPVRSGTPQLRDVVTGVNLIPASGEWVYSPDLIRRIEYPGWEETLNRHSGSGEIDVRQSLDQLQAELPNVTSVNVTLAWFGDDLRCGNCMVKPGVETAEKITLPRNWAAGGCDRSSAQLISQDDEGKPVYGGTPDDQSVLALFDEMAARGLSVTVSPFLLMDIPAGNGLSDPYGGSEQAAFPWGGRVTASTDKTAQTRLDVEAFFGTAQASDFSVSQNGIRYSGPVEWSYRRFVLHLAALSKQSGKVDRFLLGSELRGLTLLRDENGAYPAVEQLIALAAEVRTLVGPEVEISYAADWTEYGAYCPGDGTGDVLFPLDALWADDEINSVGIDWYAPLSDWRDGAHIDAESYDAITDPDYLAVNIEGGEGYDWYYASLADRDGQIRTPISDMAHGEDWVFRVKDIRSWWQNAHYERPSGVRASEPTGWSPQSKPIRLIEIGCGAVDKGTNAPNVFLDPKSAESGVPPFSEGTRDDDIQAAAIRALYDYWSSSGGQNPVSTVYSGPMIPADGLSVWCWDARPFPAFPSRSDVWSDGANWTTGHWLNGRTSQSDLGSMIQETFEEAGIPLDTLSVTGNVPGYMSAGLVSVRNFLEPLANLFAVSCRQSEAGLSLFNLPADEVQTLPAEALAMDGMSPRGLVYSRTTTEHAPRMVQLTFADMDDGFQPASVRVGDWSEGDQDIHIQLPLALTATTAEGFAETLYARFNEAPVSERLVVSPEYFEISVGDLIIAGDLTTARRVSSLTRQGVLHLDLSAPLDVYAGQPGFPSSGNDLTHSPKPDFVVLDLPALPGAIDDARPLVGAFASPWPGQITVEAGRSETVSSVRATLTSPARIGRLVGALPGGPGDRFRPGLEIEVIFPDADLSSRARLDVLNGANLIAIETEAGWMLAGFDTAEQVTADRWRLGGLLTGLFGTDDASALGALDGARIVVIDDALQRAEFGTDEFTETLVWQAFGPGSLAEAASDELTLSGRSFMPFRPGHLTAKLSADGEVQLSWTRRARHSADGWEGESVPLLEESERYRVEIMKEGELQRSVDVSDKSWIYTASDQASDGIGGAFEVKVAQLSARYGAGAAAQMSVSI